MNRLWLRFLLAAGLTLTLLATACSSCGEKTSDLLRLVPADVAGVVWMPDLGATAAGLKGLMEKFSVGPLASFINQGHIELKRALGFDPLELAELRKLGLEPTLGLAVVPQPGGSLLVVGVADPKQLGVELHGRMKQLAGAEDISTEEVDGLTVTTLSVAAGAQKTPVLRYAFSGKFALLTEGKTPAASLARLPKLKPEESLAGAPWFQSLRGRAPQRADLVIVVNGVKAAAMAAEAKQLGLGEGMVVALGLDKAGVDAQVFLALEPASAKRFADLTEGVQDVHLERFLPADSVFALKARVNVERLLQTATAMNPEFKGEYERAMQEGDKALGGNFEARTVKNLTGNFALGLRFGQADQVNRLIEQLRQMDEQPGAQPAAPMAQALQVFYWAQIRDAAAWAQLVETVLPLLSEEAHIAVEKKAAGTLTSLRLSGQEIRYDVYLLQGKDVVGGCFGTGCAELAAQLVDGKAAGLPGDASRAARALLEEPSLAVGYLDFSRVLAVLKGLDANLLGEGGMLAKMAIDLATTAVQNLKELTAVVRFLPEGVHFAGHLEIQ